MENLSIALPCFEARKVKNSYYGTHTHAHTHRLGRIGRGVDREKGGWSPPHTQCSQHTHTLSHTHTTNCAPVQKKGQVQVLLSCWGRDDKSGRDCICRCPVTKFSLLFIYFVQEEETKTKLCLSISTTKKVFNIRSNLWVSRNVNGDVCRSFDVT